MNRTWTVLSLIEARGYKRYLEIGCRGDECFSQVKIEKVGVDPVSGGTHRMTSDEFFSALADDDVRFDLIFIDGDHHHDQVMKDVKNALAVLAPGGCIVMHDCLPPNQIHESPVACGTVWRAFAKLRIRKDLECFCGDYDFGCGIVQRKKNSMPIEIPQSMDEMTYQQFEENRTSWMRPLSFEAMQALISNKGRV